MYLSLVDDTKNLSNSADIKKERLFIHAKDVETNCTKALQLCLSKDSPYSSYYENNATFPSGENWWDYAKWVRKEMYKLIEKYGGTRDFTVADTVDITVCEGNDEVEMDENILLVDQDDKSISKKKKTIMKKKTGQNKNKNSKTTIPILLLTQIIQMI